MDYENVNREGLNGVTRLTDKAASNLQKTTTADNEEIIELLIKAKTKREVNNGLLKYFANETVSAMLKVLAPLIKDLSGR